MSDRDSDACLTVGDVERFGALIDGLKSEVTQLYAAFWCLARSVQRNEEVGAVIEAHVLVAFDKDRAVIETQEDPATGGVVVRAVLR